MLEAQLSAWLLGPMGGICLTLIAYQLGVWCYQYCGQLAVLHPVISGTGLLALFIYIAPHDYVQYTQSVEFLSMLLGPIVVAMAVPLYQQIRNIRSLLLPIFMTLIFVAFFAATSAVALAWFFGAEEAVLLSLAPKSVTTPIAIALAEELGGLGTLAAGVVIITGAFGIIVCKPMLDRLNIRDPRVLGFTLGLNAHGIGTARAFEYSTQAGAFASLGLSLCGSLTAIALPLIVAWL